MVTAERIVAMARGPSVAAVLSCALENGLFTELGKGPRSYRQLRRALGLREPAASELLDALVALSLLGREGSGRDAIYVNTRESGQFLDRNSPGYIGAQLGKSLTETLRGE